MSRQERGPAGRGVSATTHIIRRLGARLLGLSDVVTVKRRRRWRWRWKWKIASGEVGVLASGSDWRSFASQAAGRSVLKSTLGQYSTARIGGIGATVGAG